MFFYLKFMWEKRALNGIVLNQIEMFPIFEQDLISDSISAAPKHHMVQTPIDLPFFRSISLFRKCHLTTKLIWQVVSSLSGNQSRRGGTNTLLTKRPTQVLISNTLAITWALETAVHFAWIYFHTDLIEATFSFKISEKNDILWPLFRSKHCQRDNKPGGWVKLIKVTCLGHFTSSNTNLAQISSSEYRTSINFKISDKQQHLDLTWNSKYWPNLASESRPRFNFIILQNNSSKILTKVQLQILPELQPQNLDQTFWIKVPHPHHQHQQQ